MLFALTVVALLPAWLYLKPTEEKDLTGQEVEVVFDSVRPVHVMFSSYIPADICCRVRVCFPDDPADARTLSMTCKTTDGVINQLVRPTVTSVFRVCVLEHLTKQHPALFVDRGWKKDMETRVMHMLNDSIRLTDRQMESPTAIYGLRVTSVQIDSVVYKKPCVGVEK